MRKILALIINLLYASCWGKAQRCVLLPEARVQRAKNPQEVVTPGNVWVKLRADADTLHEELAVFCTQLAKAEESQNTFTVYQLPDFL